GNRGEIQMIESSFGNVTAYKLYIMKLDEERQFDQLMRNEHQADHYTKIMDKNMSMFMGRMNKQMKNIVDRSKLRYHQVLRNQIYKNINEYLDIKYKKIIAQYDKQLENMNLDFKKL